jgi:hypothetical protein
MPRGSGRLDAVRRARSIAGLLLAVALTGAPAGATTLTIQVGDQPGEGFNDTTPFTPIGSNAATTLGAARVNVFKEAARVWSLLLAESVTVTVKATFDPLDCSDTSGTLGNAGPEYVYLRNGYWVPGPLYVATGGSGASASITATFNSSVGSSGCLGGKPFYYGLDHQYSRTLYVADLLEVVLHELGHGLGFVSFVGSDGNGTITDRQGTPHLGVFDQFVFDETQGRFWPAMTAAERATSALNDGNLVWNGANVNNQLGFLTAGTTSGQHLRLYAPRTWDDGSSVSHWDTTASPNLLMEPYATGSTKGYTDLTTCVLYDIGWSGSHCPDVAGANAAPVAAAQSVSTTAGTAVAITLVATDADSATLSYSIVSGPAHGALSGSGSERTYTPAAGFTGTDSFSFQASDGFSSSNVATVTITVAAAAGAAGSSGSGGGGGGGALAPYPLLALAALALRAVAGRRRALRRRVASAQAR